MRIVDIRERPVRISRHRDPHIPSDGLTTSLVAVVTDVARAARPVVGYGFASIGRCAQSGLIRERFAHRLLRAATQDVITDDGANLDLFRAWTVMMAGEKPGGHGERCVAVGHPRHGSVGRRSQDICDPLDLPPTPASPRAMTPRSLPARHCSLPLKRHCSTGTRACGAPATFSCSIPCTAMVYPATCRSSTRSRLPAGPGTPSGRTAATCSASTSSRLSASASPRSTRWPSIRSTAHRRPASQRRPHAPSRRSPNRFRTPQRRMAGLPITHHTTRLTGLAAASSINDRSAQRCPYGDH
jgi:hypothetical protein